MFKWYLDAYASGRRRDHLSEAYFSFGSAKLSAQYYGFCPRLPKC